MGPHQTSPGLIQQLSSSSSCTFNPDPCLYTHIHRNWSELSKTRCGFISLLLKIFSGYPLAFQLFIVTGPQLVFLASLQPSSHLPPLFPPLLTISFVTNSPSSTPLLMLFPQPEISFTPSLCEQLPPSFKNPAKNITSFLQPKQRGRSLHDFTDSRGSVCLPVQLSYWCHQSSRVRIILEIFKGEMSLELFRVLHQRELGRGTCHYTEEDASPPP